MPGLQFSLLGPLRVELPGRELRIGGARRRAVLLRLLASANRTVSLGVLAEDVWQGRPPSASVSTLQSHVSALRQVMGADRLVFVEGGYRVGVEPTELDADLFEADVSVGRAAIAAGQLESGLDRLERGLARWRGTAFADVLGAVWALGPSGRLEEERKTAVEDALQARLDLGRHREVCHLAEEAVTAEPLRERRWALWMLALYRSGRQAEALRCFQRARDMLIDELGIEPSPVLVALEREILEQSPALDWTGAGAPNQASAWEANAETNLPVGVSDFVGRQQELDDLGAAVEQHRLVTVVGPGGIGKTRLAIEVAGSRLGKFRDGVWFVDLSSVVEARNVRSAIASALGVIPTSDTPLRGVLQGWARDAQALLVIDNCEHLVDAAAEAVETLLQAGKGLRILATSREALRVPGESRWLIPPFPTPSDPELLDLHELRQFDAVRLFIDRAEAAPNGEGEVSLADLREIGRLTARLDGLPLAIELVAPRAATVGLSALTALEDRLELLSGGSRSGHRRQRTLAATIDWSYQLLAPALQAAFRRLSVFTGGFTLDAAATVIPASTPETATILASLVERSMVERRATPSDVALRGDRFAMLETIREFAADRLADTESPDRAGDVGDLHSHYYFNLAATATGALSGWHQGRWLAKLEDDHANLCSAIAHLIGRPNRGGDALRMIVHLDRFWHNRGHLEECLDLLRRAIKIATDAPQAGKFDRDLQCSVLRLEGEAAVTRDASSAKDRFDAALALAEELDDDYQVALALCGLAMVTVFLGDGRSGRAVGQRSIELARRSGDPIVLGRCLTAYANNAPDDLDECRSVCEEAIEVTRRSGDRAWLAWALNNLGNALLTHRQWEAARDNFVQAQTVFDEINNPNPTALINLGWVSANEDHHASGLGYFAQALRVSRRNSLRFEGAYALLGLAWIATATGDCRHGAAVLGFADTELESCGQWWQPLEADYRAGALTRCRQELGVESDQCYASGRTVARVHMIELVLKDLPGRSPGH